LSSKYGPSERRNLYISGYKSEETGTDELGEKNGKCDTPI
jgi:hypothetical protein